MKKIEITFINGDKFEIVAETIAEMRTNYYADKDGFKFGSKEWKEEFEHSMTDYELKGWIGNNLDWKDISRFAMKVETPNVDYDKLWSDININIVE
jgi:hypothetical protein